MPSFVFRVVSFLFQITLRQSEAPSPSYILTELIFKEGLSTQDSCLEPRPQFLTTFSESSSLWSAGAVMATIGGILFPTIKLEETGSSIMMITHITPATPIHSIAVMETNVSLYFVTTTTFEYNKH